MTELSDEVKIYWVMRSVEMPLRLRRIETSEIVERYGITFKHILLEPSQESRTRQIVRHYDQDPYDRPKGFQAPRRSRGLKIVRHYDPPLPIETDRLRSNDPVLPDMD